MASRLDQGLVELGEDDAFGNVAGNGRTARQDGVRQGEDEMTAGGGVPGQDSATFPDSGQGSASARGPQVRDGRRRLVRCSRPGNAAAGNKEIEKGSQGGHGHGEAEAGGYPAGEVAA